MTGSRILSVWADPREGERNTFDVMLSLEVMAETSGEAIAAVAAAWEQIP